MSTNTTLDGLQLLLVDDDTELRTSVARYCRAIGANVDEAGDAEEAIAISERRTHDVAVLDIALPGRSGVQLLGPLREADPEIEVVMLTGEATVSSAVESMKLGASDYLTKPIELANLAAAVARAEQTHRLRKENRQFRAVLNREYAPRTMVGESRAMREIYRLIERAGPTNKPILIQGESGTGKELVARALHDASVIANKPMVVINCAALPEQLLESELFGHEKGSFTGATTAKTGLFEIADGGTLFIDEIGELAGSLQAKLLRVLEDGMLRRVGSTKERHINVRLLTASNRDLIAEVEAGRFREDLFYRIDVMTLRLPPLREREGDVALLARHFAGPEWTIEEPAMRAIECYSWPGNVRQLVNAIERAKILADGDRIERKNLPDVVARRPVLPDAAVEGETLASVQRAHICEVLRENGGNKLRAARALGVGRRTLYRLLEKHGIADF